MKIAIVYGTNLGNTAEVANLIAKEMKISNKDVYDVNDVDTNTLNQYEAFILGTSTWGIGDMVDSWQEFNFKKFNLNNKVVALFGLGDSQIYAFTFCNGLAKLHKAIQTNNKKVKIVGETSTKNYTYSESEAVKNNKFIGLVIDYDNFPDKVSEQIKDWVKNIKKYFI
ncbi:flavodoxin [Mycoplasmoides alvi]|uniref:flavodoxin n=1 Tax=Mycoplasmoides alvi TaxID=78580 RepID=UPI00051C3CB3|nr:flavodoxin [Mycoplasmoides alvi]